MTTFPFGSLHLTCIPNHTYIGTGCEVHCCTTPASPVHQQHVVTYAEYSSPTMRGFLLSDVHVRAWSSGSSDLPVWTALTRPGTSESSSDRCEVRVGRAKL